MKLTSAIEWYSENASEFDRRYNSDEDFRERYAIWTEIIDKYSGPGKKVLDVGCGSGVLTLYAAHGNRRVVGLDGSAEMVRLCEEKRLAAGVQNVEFVQAEIETISTLIKDPVDLILCSSVLEYLEHPEAFYRELPRSLKKDGILIFSAPNRESIFRKLEPLSYKLFGRPRYYKFVRSLYSRQEALLMMVQSGFEVLDIQYFGKMPILSWIFRRVGMLQFSENLFLMVARKLS